MDMRYWSIRENFRTENGFKEWKKALGINSEEVAGSIGKV